MKATILFLYVIHLATVIFLSSCGIKNDTDFFVQTAKIPEGYTHEQKVELSARVLPHPRQMLWFEDGFSGFIHFGPNTFTGREWGTGFENPAIFNPEYLDTDQWMRLMKEAGMTRVIMVAKHHDGFCLWPSRYTTHSVASSPWQSGKGDLLRDVSESARKYGLRLGIYLSPADLFQIESPEGYYGNGSEFAYRTIPRPDANRPFADQRTFTYKADDYNEYFLNQLFELLTEYGPIYEVWFDGAHPKPGTGQTYNYKAWYDLIRNLAPNAVIFGRGPDIRWCGNEGGATRIAEYNVIPLDQEPETYHWPDKMGENIAGRDMITDDTKYFHYYPAETNTSIRHGWFWRNDDEQQVRSADDVFDIYERSAGGNSVLLLNIPPNNKGLFSERDSKVLIEVGRRIREVYGTNLLTGGRATTRKLIDDNPETWWQAPGKQAEFIVRLPGSKLVNRVVIQEAIAHRGERVEQHKLYAWIDDAWQEVAQGTTIGHKRILRFPAVQTNRFKVVITESRMPPAVSNVAAHFFDEPPKPVVMRMDEHGMLMMGVGTSFVWNNHGAIDLSQTIHYTKDGSEPGVHSYLYREPIHLPLGGHISARAVSSGNWGSTTSFRFGINKIDWTASDAFGNTIPVANIIDGNPHTGWVSGVTKEGQPQKLTIDMKQSFTIAGLAYLPYTRGGFIEAFTIEVSSDGSLWNEVHRGEFGNIVNDPTRRVILFDKNYDARFVRLSGLKAPGNLSAIGASEIDIFSSLAR
ncbi:MAG TPA: alpha-L-fucosidase [Bacteroidales bacterium]|nr:alpha-L-fucosidase [Bacteroidales bacterium]